MLNLKNLDFRFYAMISLLVLWASTTFSIALMEISIVCGLAFWVLGKTSINPEQRWITPRVDWALWAPLALFFTFVLLSFFVSESSKESLRGILKIAKPLLVFMMISDLFRNSAFQKKFETTFLIVFLLVAIDCSIQYAFGKDFLRGFAAEQSSAGIRLVGPFGNFAKMSTFLVLVIPVFAMRFWSDFICSEKRKRSFYALALALVGGVLLYLTRCRGPVVALAFSFGILFIYKRWFKVLGLGIVFFLAILAMSPRSVIVHEDAQGKEQSIVERFELWKRALDVIDAKPWTGTGINTYNVVHEKYDKTQNWRVRGYYAHNGYLQLTAEIGIPGIFCFFGFLFMFFRRAMQSIQRVRDAPEEYIRLGYLTGLLAFLIYAAFDNNLQSPPSLMMFWFLAGMLMARQNPGESRLQESPGRRTVPA